MSNPRRQRHMLPLTLQQLTSSAVLTLHLFALYTILSEPKFVSATSSTGSTSNSFSSNPQQAGQVSQQYLPPHHQSHRTIGTSKAFLLSPSTTNNFLVRADQSETQLVAQSLPLVRPQQQQPDLDNVIESTTSLALAPQQRQQSVNGKFAAPPTTSCQLPPTWAGKWYLSGHKEPIRVTNTEISDKGLCRDQKGDKFLFESNGGINSKQLQQQQQQSAPCLVCLVINERHLNVLQYKESSCQPIPANYYNRTTNNLLMDDDHSLLDTICSDITGDAQLESLFRLDTPAIECPINGQYSFTYDNCREPQSLLDSCIDKKQLSFRFSACPDVPGSESKSEVLKCYADWSEGNNYYMIGRLEQASNHQDKGKFRCFVYEKSSDGKFIQMAQSLEESCYGLINANEGPKTLRLTIKPPTLHQCHFPSYIQSLSENWLSVDNSLIYMFNQNSTKYQVKETKEGSVIEEATCLQQFTHPQTHATPHPHLHHQHSYQHPKSNQQVFVDTGYQANRRFPSSTSGNPQADQSAQQAIASRSAINDIVYLVQITKSCQTTNYCVRFHKRSNGIVQIDYFVNAPNSDNQCRNAFVSTPSTQIITSTNLEPQRCPLEGAYTIEASLESDLTYNPSNIFICPRQSFLTAQCDHPSRMRIHSRCSSSKSLIKSLYCLGSWTTNGVVRLILTDDDRQRYSAWYRDYSLTMPMQDESPQVAITRSQHLLAASNSPQLALQSLAPIVDLQIAVIAPMPILTKPMQVRLTRRSQCTELRGYSNQGTFGSPISSIPSYASSTTASSSASSGLNLAWTHNLYLSCMILIVTLLVPSLNRTY